MLMEMDRFRGLCGSKNPVKRIFLYMWTFCFVLFKTKESKVFFEEVIGFYKNHPLTKTRAAALFGNDSAQGTSSV